MWLVKRKCDGKYYRNRGYPSNRFSDEENWTTNKRDCKPFMSTSGAKNWFKSNYLSRKGTIDDVPEQYRGKEGTHKWVDDNGSQWVYKYYYPNDKDPYVWIARVISFDEYLELVKCRVR